MSVYVYVCAYVRVLKHYKIYRHSDIHVYLY